MSYGVKPTPTLMSALTHVHVGVGRSPGAVDLPIIRDPFGIPFIPGSSVKGALKTMLSNMNGCVITNENDPKVGRTNCQECPEICCWLGPEEGTEGASRLVITDFYPLLVPVPSLDKGFAYVTFERLLKYAEALGVQKDNLFSNSDSTKEEKNIIIGIEEFPVKEVCLWNGPQVHPFLSNNTEVYVLEDKFAKPIFNRITVKVTRVRIDRSKKTVATGALWTEEYLPHGTILIGAIVERAWNNEACKKVKNIQPGGWKTVLGFNNNNNSIELVLGGKETVGKGLVRLTIIG